MPKLRFYSLDNPPPVIKCDASNKSIPVYGWEYNDESGQVEPVKVGERDPQADINAAKGETLTEILARTPGKNHMEKLNNAVSAGLIGAAPMDGEVIDLRAVHRDFVDNMAVVEEGANAYKSNPDIAKAEGSSYTEKALNFYRAKIAELEASQKKPQEGENQQ